MITLATLFAGFIRAFEDKDSCWGSEASSAVKSAAQLESTFPVFSIPGPYHCTCPNPCCNSSGESTENIRRRTYPYTLSEHYSSRLHFAERLVFSPYFVRTRLGGSVFSPNSTNDKIRQFTSAKFSPNSLSEHFTRITVFAITRISVVFSAV